jgi:hypothetical protein
MSSQVSGVGSAAEGTNYSRAFLRGHLGSQAIPAQETAALNKNPTPNRPCAKPPRDEGIKHVCDATGALAVVRRVATGRLDRRR